MEFSSADSAGAAFDPEAFVAACRRGVEEPDAAAACARVVRDALSTGVGIDEALGVDEIGPVTLFADAGLTVQRIVWPPGVRSAPHDHRMWAVVGVYRGTEHNIIYERDGSGLVERERRQVEAGDVLTLDAAAIHGVANPSDSVVAGLHVYGGDIDGIERSQWLPDGTELPLGEARAIYAPMWAAARAAMAEMGVGPYEAYGAVVRRVDELQRVLTEDEVRSAVASASG